MALNLDISPTAVTQFAFHQLDKQNNACACIYALQFVPMFYSVSEQTKKKKFKERVRTLPSISARVSLALVCSGAEKLRKAVAVITLAEIEQHASLPFFR